MFNTVRAAMEQAKQTQLQDYNSYPVVYDGLSWPQPGTVYYPWAPSQWQLPVYSSATPVKFTTAQPVVGTVTINGQTFDLVPKSS
ncbi:hypothetical protein GUITHDRAFT_119892 [Guillardia theta CCMP2712]|uniref:Uncharacterized protein n=1 Tax=Guillardia theta (strain CCMP2712) TaxID=905079 RepID=L1IDC2_GUITC|nr:hypothetical protein GUITHDRAFT_119892 [Guillardia theta CCMP2712]EKX33909.1 hypothetical protein GUITHDRAFT_119892 [Guillardia theta CCMP2712]|mmetsp:Transcript_9643/g.32279  ORF Transcript_9643/g.32279 Transcript_9643/m.32279 type:complete len:85 (+) Transcript_9643:57-311(+)|eukprot:XP_005820889.1 hypothetical protein GUITHDRAFT_119892 [Guillardia theta CCMP2712]